MHVDEGRTLEETAELLGWWTESGAPAIGRVFQAMERARDHLARLLTDQASE
jgi:hypothetical protein